jgi:hypothetical protein
MVELHDGVVTYSGTTLNGSLANGVLSLDPSGKQIRHLSYLSHKEIRSIPYSSQVSLHWYRIIASSFAYLDENTLFLCYKV